jgi:hypothetical protein
MLPELSYEEALVECTPKTLKSRREDVCINLIKSSLHPGHKLHNLFPPKVYENRNKETRLSGEKIYNFNCQTRFKNSAIVFGIEQYNKV